MEILKIATEWARAEVFSSRFFILAAIMFLFAAVGFWQIGKTEVARAYIYPTLIAGLLLMAVGVGIFFTNKSRVTSFVAAYNSDPMAFVESEIVRTEKSMGEFRTIVFKAIPFIIVAASLLGVGVPKDVMNQNCVLPCRRIDLRRQHSIMGPGFLVDGCPFA